MIPKHVQAQIDAGFAEAEARFELLDLLMWRLVQLHMAERDQRLRSAFARFDAAVDHAVQLLGCELGQPTTPKPESLQQPKHEQHDHDHANDGLDCGVERQLHRGPEE